MGERKKVMKDSSERRNIDKAIMRRLVLCRNLYDHAEENSKHNRPIDKMIAIHNFHNAIEVMLKVIIDYQGIPEQDGPWDRSFYQLQEAIDKFPANENSGNLVPDRSMLKNLNHQRNMVQHSAAEPEEGMMIEWRYVTHKFLVDVAKQYFKLEFDEISTVDLVVNEQIRDLLKIAESQIREFEKEDRKKQNADQEADLLYLRALASLMVTFMTDFGSVIWSEPVEDIHRLLRSQGPSKDDSEENSEISILKSRISELEMANLCQLLDIDYRNYKLLEDVGLGVALDGEGKPGILTLNADTRSRPDLLKMMEFVKDLVVSWEKIGWLPDESFESEDPIGIAVEALLHPDKTLLILDEDAPNIDNEKYLDLSDVLKTGYGQYISTYGSEDI